MEVVLGAEVVLEVVQAVVPRKANVLVYFT